MTSITRMDVISFGFGVETVAPINEGQLTLVYFRNGVIMPCQFRSGMQFIVLTAIFSIGITSTT